MSSSRRNVNITHMSNMNNTIDINNYRLNKNTNNKLQLSRSQSLSKLLLTNNNNNNENTINKFKNNKTVNNINSY